MSGRATFKPSQELVEAMNGSCHCLAIRKRARQLTRVYDEQLLPYGFTIGQFGILTMIASRGQISVQELADALDLDQSALSRGLAPLERAGLFQSLIDPSDRRRRVLKLTPDALTRVSAAAFGWKKAQSLAEKSGGMFTVVNR